MTFNINVVQNLENKHVLLKETNGKRKTSERLYILPEENADEFIKEKKFLAKHSKFQKIMTYVMSGLIGLLVGLVVKFPLKGKVLSGLATGAVGLAGGLGTDKMLNKKLEEYRLKKYNAVDVSGQKPEDIQ